MFFTFLALPQGNPVNITTSFDALSTSPETQTKITNISNMRNSFYAGLAELTSKPLNDTVPEFPALNYMPYLQAEVDLMEIAVKQANYPLNFSY